MDLKKLHELAKLADLCRKKGIESIKVSADSYEFKLSPDAPKSNYKKKAEKAVTLDAGLPESAAPTEEEVLFWSSEGLN